MERDSHVGNYAWAAAIGGVALWDILSPETMSSAMDRYLQSKARYVAIGAVLVTAAHLLNVIPEKYDPFTLIPNLPSRYMQTNAIVVDTISGVY